MSWFLRGRGRGLGGRWQRVEVGLVASCVACSLVPSHAGDLPTDAGSPSKASITWSMIGS